MKKELNLEEIKKALIEMLRYIDEICRKNNIEYSVIAGTMLGAVRHKGFIPWDDDIDIALTKDNYDKLLDVLKNQTGRYQLFTIDKTKNYNFTFAKLVDTKTILIDEKSLRPIENYGLYVDIFCFVNTSDNKLARKHHFNEIKRLNSLITLTNPKQKGISLTRKMLRKTKRLVSCFISRKILINRFAKVINKYYGKKTKYMVPIFFVAGVENEIIDTPKEYVDLTFENIKVMSFSEYKKILSKKDITFIFSKVKSTYSFVVSII